MDRQLSAISTQLGWIQVFIILIFLQIGGCQCDTTVDEGAFNNNEVVETNHD